MAPIEPVTGEHTLLDVELAVNEVDGETNERLLLTVGPNIYRSVHLRSVLQFRLNPPANQLCYFRNELVANGGTTWNRELGLCCENQLAEVGHLDHTERKTVHSDGSEQVVGELLLSQVTRRELIFLLREVGVDATGTGLYLRR